MEHYQQIQNETVSMDKIIAESYEGTKELFKNDFLAPIPTFNEEASLESRNCKYLSEYAFSQKRSRSNISSLHDEKVNKLYNTHSNLNPSSSSIDPSVSNTNQLLIPLNSTANENNFSMPPSMGSRELIRRKQIGLPKPTWHAPWKLMRVNKIVNFALKCILY